MLAPPAGPEAVVRAAAVVRWGLPNSTPGATNLPDFMVAGCRQGDRAQASLASSTRFIEVGAAVWTNNTAREVARNISGATFDLAAATLSAAVAKRRAP
jgi:hypothetical protein